MAVGDKAVQRGTALSSQVHAALAESIATGRIAPRERVVLDRIAEQLGVSPTPVREAINRLIQDGLIEDAGNGRFHVVGLTPEYVINTFGVRGVLEGLAAELAAPRISTDHLAALRQALTDIDTTVDRGEYEVFASLDNSLHQIIRDAAGNPVLSRELRPLQIHIGLIFAHVNETYSRQQLAEYVQCSHAEHKRIVDVLAARDPRAARETVEQHVRDAGERYAGLIRNSASQPTVTHDPAASGE
jgi:DNA-binding GntR family transcriptional regulator